MVKQFAVIGLGRFGSAVAKTLESLGHQVMGIDRDEALAQSLATTLTHVVQADCTDEETLKSLGLRNLDTVVVAIGDDLQASILICLLLKELGVPNVIAKATTELHGKVLTKIGADRVVFPERDMGMRVAHNLVASNVLDYIELSPDYSIVELNATESMHGKTLRQLALRARFGVNIMAIRTGDVINVSPKAEDAVQPGDILVLIGDNEALRRIEQA